MKGLALDCACGLNPLGCRSEAVRVDLSRTYAGKKNAADVIADAHALPFANGVFRTVFSSHTLEHCRNPLQVLQEFKRVGGVLVIKVPNATFNKGGLNEDDGHLFSWTSKTFSQLLSLVYCDVRLTTRIHWEVRGYARVHGLGLKQLAILKTLLFVLILGEKNELEAFCC